MNIIGLFSLPKNVLPSNILYNIVKELVESVVLSSDADFDILVESVRNDHPDIVKLLLDCENLNLTGRDHDYILVYAMENNYTDIIESLIRNTHIDPTIRNNCIFKFMSKRGRTDTIEFLLWDWDNQIDSDTVSCGLVLAAEYGHADIVRLLLADDRCDPSWNYNEAIEIAAEYNHTETIKILLADPRVDPNGEVLSMATGNSNEEIVQLLMADNRVGPSDMGKNNEEDLFIYCMIDSPNYDLRTKQDILNQSDCTDISIKTSTSTGKKIICVEFEI